jgi:glycosyltransferase involved in cell wall biosynthesis
LAKVKLSVVVVTYNRCRDLQESLNCLLALKKTPYEIIVVDSNSTDCTHDVVKEYPVKFINIKERSMVKARNIGLQHAKGDVVAYVDDDAVVSEDWSEYILEPYGRLDVGGVGGRVVSSDHDVVRVNMPRKYLQIGRVFNNGFVLNNYDIPTLSPIEVDTLIGCNMSFRRKLLLAVGGFDENFKGSCFRDDTDISTRVRRQNYSLVYHPKALVWHKYKGKVIDRKWFYWYSYNHFYYCFKNLQPVTPRKFISLLHGAFLPPTNYVKRSNIRLKADPFAAFYIVKGIIEAKRTYRRSHAQEGYLSRYEQQ